MANDSWKQRVGCGNGCGVLEEIVREALSFWRENENDVFMTSLCDSTIRPI